MEQETVKKIIELILYGLDIKTKQIEKRLNNEEYQETSTEEEYMTDYSYYMFLCGEKHALLTLMGGVDDGLFDHASDEEIKATAQQIQDELEDNTEEEEEIAEA